MGWYQRRVHGESGENTEADNMFAQVLCISMLSLAAMADPQSTHNLPVLFQFSQPGHNVAVFRGAQLKQAIADGLVPGFGNLGRSGKSVDDGAAAAANTYATTPAPPPPPPTTTRYVPPPPPAPSPLELAEQACVQACRNLAGQCKPMYG